MHRLFSLAVALLFVPLVFAEETDPEPPSVTGVIQSLERDSSNDRIDQNQFEKRRKQAVIRLEKLHADLVKRGKKDEARAVKDYILLAGSISKGAGLETKLTVPKLMEKASANGRYRELLHVLYMPTERANYTDFSDYGMSATPNYGPYNGLATGYWVYVHPRWYIWKELKPGK
jgi:hypothetical protein